MDAEHNYVRVLLGMIQAGEIPEGAYELGIYHKDECSGLVGGYCDCEPRMEYHPWREDNMYHKILIVGNLGNDPQLRYTPAGSPVCNFSVAVNQKAKDDVTTLWFRCTCWGSQAEACNEYLSKGRAVLVEGTLKADRATGSPQVYTRNDGTCGASYEVTASTVRFLGSREQEPEPEQEEMPF